MKIKEIIFVFIVASVFFAIGCENGGFEPPEDGTVTKEMADRYIKVSLALTEIIEDQVVKLADFRGKHGISESLTEFSDEEYKTEHPEIVAAWDSIQDIWEQKQDSVYNTLGMSEEEWNWIAGAIITHQNKEMRQYIINEFERLKKESDSLPQAAKDSN